MNKNEVKHGFTLTHIYRQLESCTACLEIAFGFTHT